MRRRRASSSPRDDSSSARGSHAASSPLASTLIACAPRRVRHGHREGPVVATRLFTNARSRTHGPPPPPSTPPLARLVYAAHLGLVEEAYRTAETPCPGPR